MTQSEQTGVINTRWLPISLLCLGTVIYFIAERYLGGESYKLAVAAVGLALVVGGWALTFLQAVKAKSLQYLGQARSMRLAFMWMTGFILSLILYIFYNTALGDAVIPSTFLQKALLASWVLCLLISIFAGIGTELAIRDNGFGPNADARRVQRSATGWALVGMLLCSLVGFNYTAAKRDVAQDWTYLKTTEPGDSTKGMIKSLDKELTVAVFYPQDNEVLPFVSQYVEAVAREEGKIKVEYLDKDLNPSAAEKMKVSRNGQIILQQGDKRQRIDVGLTIRRARSKLKKLDGSFQKAFLKLTEEQKTVYFTRGHGEMTWLSGSSNSFRSLRLVEKLLREQNFRVKELSASSGSMNDVPEDASAIVVAGPTQPFSKEEVAALESYVTSGGNLMIFLDVDKDRREQMSLGDGPGELFLGFVERMGVLFKPETLANEGNYVAATRSQSDKWFLFSNNFTSHESVKNLAKHEESIPLLLFRTGYLVVKDKTGSWKAKETVRSMRESFTDSNKNYKHDKGERKKTYTVAAAVTYDVAATKETEAKVANVIVAADSHILADAIIGAGSPANALFLLDGLKWLIGETARSGEVSNEEDVKIRHKRKENVLWFWGSVAGVPLMIILVGFVATRRRKVR